MAASGHSEVGKEGEPIKSDMHNFAVLIDAAWLKLTYFFVVLY